MILLREAHEGDLTQILAWRNNPLVFGATYTQKDLLSFEDHKAWWDNRSSHHKSFMVLLCPDIRPIGVIHISLLDYWAPEIGVYIAPEEWNKGYGTEAFQGGLDYLKSRGFKYTMTTVPERNKACIRMLRKLQFKKTGKARDGEIRFERKL